MRTVIYSKYSNERNHRLAIRTDILEDENGKRYVQKVSEFPEGQLHIAALYHWYQTFTRLTEGTNLSYNRCEIIPGGVELEYLTGESLEEHLLFVKKEKGTDACARGFLDYLNFVKALHVGAVFEPGADFRKVFGEAELPLGTVCAPCSNIDLVCGNILITGDHWTAIDYEWSFDFPIPVNYLLYRIIFYFTDHADRGAEFQEYDFLGKMGITKAEVKAFEEMETNFQKYVCRNHIPIRDLYEEISDGVYRMEETFVRESLQVYYDLGEGFTEENSRLFKMAYKNYWTVQAEIELPEGLKALRLDPGSRGALVELRKLRFDNQERRAAFTLREGAVVGNWLYVGDNDPNIFLLTIPDGARKLLVDLNIHPVDALPMSEADRLAKEYVKQKKALNEAQNTIHEMKNTKVWKMYQKYRDYREK